MPAEVFVSYRREDAGDVDRVAAWLGSHFGPERVFVDVLRLQAGESFPAAIEEAIASSKAIVAVVGADWVGDLHEDDDWVRRELRDGLDQGRPIVPVLLRGVPPLVAEELPTELASLADLHAVTIDVAEPGGDFDRLVDALEKRGATPALREAFPEVAAKEWGEVRDTWDATGTESSVREHLETALGGRGLRVVSDAGDCLALAGGNRFRFRLFGGFLGPDSRIPVEGRLRIRRRGAFVSVEVLLVEDAGPGFNKSLSGRFESHFNNILRDLRKATSR